MPTLILTTQSRLLDAAERLFAEHGYSGASVRGIVAAAEVDLGAVRYHFGTKAELFCAVIARRLVPLNDERARRLDGLEERAAPSAAGVEDILRAFIEPAVDVLRAKGYGRDFVTLIARVRVERGDYLDPILNKVDTLLARFRDALCAALPDIPEREVSYRFYFTFGAEVNAFIDSITLPMLGRDLPDIFKDPEGVVRRLIRFAAAGLRAPVDEEQP